MEKQFHLLWLDLNLTSSSENTVRLFSNFFRIRKPNSKQLSDNFLNTHPAGFVFEYDFPDRGSLHLLLQTKQQFPSLPIIMITEQHSEELAVWALHARVWEYMVKPVSEQQLEALHNDFTKLEQIKLCPDTQRSSFQREQHVPDEALLNPVTPSNEIIHKAVNYIDNHIKEKINEAEIAALCGMSPYRFSRLFKEHCSCTFQEYLIKHRIDEAIRLLANPNTSITDVAYTVGFNDASYFSRAFKRYMGLNPSEYRAGQKKNKLEELPLSHL